MNFSDEDIYEAAKHHLPTVNEYVNSHGGDIKLLGTKEGIIYIELTGTCHGCSMSLMTTKMVVQRKLRELIHPELTVVNVDGTAQNVLPQEYYTQEDPKETLDNKKEGLMDKVKKLF
jgi:Fe-S cluster biogenesis protein NfuA